MIVKTEQEMIGLGERLARAVNRPCLIELIGDVGAGKTTLVKGLARGLGVADGITSPSFTINKIYPFDGGTLSHYDFYRLDDAGIMKNEIAEVLEDPNAIVVVEWAGTVQDALPENRIKVDIKYSADGTRTVQANGVHL
ncbi:MAG: tRNA (adenosine(37)-N6)-threonylcarbamoyltransferase complex ATPase subunit type 1 TsaE [Candidatus Nomurabacteria bacterium]|nr:tRNA (adenosine(37)-N6)-threonylcarbamoyltransferase complex ATPase subunit type 1 TsaE [Candidatus Nomurabacteria bacterium]